MKGEWVYDDQLDIWHLIYSRINDGDELVAWCGKSYALKSEKKPGEQLGLADVLHDECVRKSEEL